MSSINDVVTKGRSTDLPERHNRQRVQTLGKGNYVVPDTLRQALVRNVEQHRPMPSKKNH